MSRSNKLALSLLAGTQFVLVLDASIINVALPSIGRDLDVAPEDLSWVVNAYILMFGGFLLFGGRVADFVGRRRMFIAGLAIFSLASLIGGMAQSAPWLVAARAAQGLGAALVSPAALALLMSLFTEGAARNRALAVWAALGGSGGAAGAILGGVLSDGLGWQAVLFVNVPVGLAAVLIAPRLLPESRGQSNRHFDVAGALSVTAGLALLVYVIVDANEAGWGSPQTLTLTSVALALVALFVLIEGRSRHPLMPLRIWANRSLRGGNIVTVLNTGALFPMFFFLTLYTQDVLGYSAIESGMAQLPLAATIAVSATLAPRVVERAGARWTLVTGLALLAIGLVWFGQLPVEGSFLANLLAPSLVVGVAEGLVWVASMVGATSGAAEEDAGLASGLVNTSQQLGGALGVAALVAVATAQTEVSLAEGASQLSGLTDGFSAGLTVGAGIAAAGAVLAGILLAPQRQVPGRRRLSPQEGAA